MAEKHDSGCEMDEDVELKEGDEVDSIFNMGDVMDMDEMENTNDVAAIASTAVLPSDKTIQNEQVHKSFNEVKSKLVGVKSLWDPFISPDWDNESASTLCISRLKRDLTAIYSEALPLIYVVPEENDITKVHAVISGPLNTPYEGGFFYFVLRAPPTYPIQPPRVKLMTTGQGTVRFNPNFYPNGKVCLSTLGTWAGPQWSAAQSLLSLLLSIQSLMNEKPYHNEPGFDNERCHGDSDQYNKCIIHETLRVAACDMAEGYLAHHMPASLQQLVEKCFVTYREHYQDVIERFKHTDGYKLNDPHNGNTGVFQFTALEERVNKLTHDLMEKHSI